MGDGEGTEENEEDRHPPHVRFSTTVLPWLRLCYTSKSSVS